MAMPAMLEDRKFKKVEIEGKSITLIILDEVVELYLDPSLKLLGHIVFGGSPFRFKSVQEVIDAITNCQNHVELEQLVLNHCFRPEYYNPLTGTVLNFLPVGIENINQLMPQYSVELSSRSGLNSVIANGRLELKDYWELMGWLSQEDRLPLQVKTYMVEKGWFEG